jgi:hypothetical protein
MGPKERVTPLFDLALDDLVFARLLLLLLDLEAFLAVDSGVTVFHRSEGFGRTGEDTDDAKAEKSTVSPPPPDEENVVGDATHTTQSTTDGLETCVMLRVVVHEEDLADTISSFLCTFYAGAMNGCRRVQII